MTDTNSDEKQLHESGCAVCLAIKSIVEEGAKETGGRLTMTELAAQFHREREVERFRDALISLGWTPPKE